MQEKISAVLDAAKISEDKGFVPVRDTYQSEPYDNVYAVTP